MKGKVCAMLSIRDLRIDPACLGKKLLVDIAPFYVYTPEKKRTDVIQGYRYTVALPDLHLEKISVKIDGNQLIEKAEGYPEVEFNGFEMRAYQDDNKNVLFTAKAESVALVNPGKKPS